MQMRSGGLESTTSAIMSRIKMDSIMLLSLILILQVNTGYAIQCYQCDSNENPDLCPQESPFDTSINAMVDCNSFEANVPGQFCVKIYQESPGWGAWIKITRRCASRTDQGVAWGCRWAWDNVGVFKNTCYCEADGCNSSTTLTSSVIVSCLLVVVVTLVKYLR